MGVRKGPDCSLTSYSRSEIEGDKEPDARLSPAPWCMVRHLVQGSWLRAEVVHQALHLTHYIFDPSNGLRWVDGLAYCLR